MELNKNETRDKDDLDRKDPSNDRCEKNFPS